ncbi:hypothetical protein H112_03983 [Trichophyton rubrum D6]|uniref:Rhomboid family membrane protein n=4 Tax=Trichophyton TaxID=5550 RepID=A0A178EXY1_TRIRU|nr:uncharacterized protein TERG_05307 [Trichophyton rubrum CBS 118892]EZF23267.1 hypothetical protein H100_03990 [Trichophyton rubrum MR850]EZF42406.1 hypothetical protein H102_03976 [Trichophyton rubrum CBS 100081]EZF53004.1 hypothetical protein H103_03990 [Trichophyton rubrum CBS 288.86]EZF63542.1 hypothetical protein H104_03976 [Trichophyton rubrum CBS 289.86]EZF74315.1 hypothetical protein H105_04005 [Trichophyton soudanense CBS 452.61]EZF84904.1 hypothetical protein H110_03983 [Trichophy
MSQPSELAQKRAEDYKRFKFYAAVGIGIAAPIIIALPPRKLDIYTASLITACVASVDYLLTERTGKGILSQMATLVPAKPALLNDLPTKKAEELNERMRIARIQEQELERLRGSMAGEEEEEEEKPSLRKSIRKFWMGRETEGWVERRREEERKALAEGKTYSEIMMDYVREAWRLDEGREQDGNAEKSPAEQQEVQPVEQNETDSTS